MTKAKGVHFQCIPFCYTRNGESYTTTGSLMTGLDDP